MTTAVLVLALTRGGDASAEGAEPSVDEIKAAEADFNRGREAYKAGDYVEAAEYFESADGHAPNEKVLELAIMARDKAGNADRAATDAQLALEGFPNSERLRKVAAPLVDKARAELFQVTIECTEPCSLLDGTRLVHGPAAARRTVFLTPGEHAIRAGWSDERAAAQSVTGAAGETATLSFVAPPIPKKEEAAVASPTAAPGQDVGVKRRPPLSPLVFFIGAGATVALGGVTVWSGIDTINNPGTSKVRDACFNNRSECQRLYDTGRSSQLRTNLLIGATSLVGAATAVVGVFFTNWSGKKDETAASVSPWVSYASGPTVGATGRF